MDLSNKTVSLSFKIMFLKARRNAELKAEVENARQRAEAVKGPKI